jgi:hypothetical protein
LGGRAILVPVTESASPAPTIAPTAAPRPARRRPFGLYVVAALRLVHAVELLLIGLGIGDIALRTLPVVETDDISILRIIYVGSGALISLGIIGLLAMRRWGWVLTMVLVGVGLFFELIQISRGHPDHFALLTLVISAFYLGQRSVREMATGSPGTEIDTV